MPATFGRAFFFSLRHERQMVGSLTNLFKQSHVVSILLITIQEVCCDEPGQAGTHDGDLASTTIVNVRLNATA